MSLWMAEHGASVVAVDGYQAQIEVAAKYAREQGIANLEFHVADACELATLQSGTAGGLSGGELIDNRTWIHLPIGRTARTTLGPPKTERSIFRTLRAQEQSRCPFQLVATICRELAQESAECLRR